MADEVAKRDQNFVTVLMGVTDDTDQDTTMLRVDPISKRLLVKADGSSFNDHKVLVSVADTTANYLSSKLVAGTNIALTVQNPGGNENIRIDVTGLVTGVSSVSNSDGTLTISPTTGAVIASLALAHANVWTGQQTLTATSDATVGTIVKGFSGTQSADLQQWQDSSANILSRVNSSGFFFIGTQETITVHAVGVAHQLQLNSNTQAIEVISSHNATAANGSVTYGARSRGTIAARTIVASGDTVRQDVAVGYDGTDYEQLGYTQWVVDATPGANDMPGRWEVWTTADGAFTPTRRMVVTNGGALLALGSTATAPASGAGTRMMWVPGKFAFRSGAVSGTNWDDINIGNYSVAMGENSKVTGANSFAGGQANSITDAYSATFGSANSITTVFAFASGAGNVISGAGGSAFGVSNSVSGFRAFSAGDSNVASGQYSFVGGHSNHAGADASFSFGQDNTSNGFCGGTLGYNNFSNALYAFAIGNSNTAASEDSFAIGYNNNVVGGSTYSMAIGNGNVVSAPNSLALGYSNNVSATLGFAFGNSCVVTNNNSFAMGYVSTANGNLSFAFGDTYVNNLDNSFGLGFDAGIQVFRASNTNGIEIGLGAGLGGYNLPLLDGTFGQALITDGAGNVSWGSGGGGMWGSIRGNITLQKDLWYLLNAKNGEIESLKGRVLQLENIVRTLI